MNDFLDGKRREMATRLDELQPLVAEYHRLEAAVSALDSIPATPNGASPTRTSTSPGRRPGRPRGSKAPPAVPSSTSAPTKGRGDAKRRGGRRRGTGKRITHTLALVEAQPGIAISELADRMGIKQSYLYKVLPALQKEGKVTKQKRGWHPVAKVA